MAPHQPADTNTVTPDRASKQRKATIGTPTMNRKRGRADTSATPTATDAPAPTDSPAKRMRVAAANAKADNAAAETPKVGRPPSTRRRQAMLANAEAAAGQNSSRGNSSSSPSELEHSSGAPGNAPGVVTAAADPKPATTEDDQPQEQDAGVAAVTDTPAKEDQDQQQPDPDSDSKQQTPEQSPASKRQRKARPPAVTVPDAPDSGDLMPTQLDTSRCLLTLNTSLHSPRLLFNGSLDSNGGDQSAMLEQLIMARDLTDPPTALRHLRMISGGNGSPSNNPHSTSTHESEDANLTSDGRKDKTRGQPDSDQTLISLGSSLPTRLHIAMLVSPTDGPGSDGPLTLDTPIGGLETPPGCLQTPPGCLQTPRGCLQPPRGCLENPRGSSQGNTRDSGQLPGPYSPQRLDSHQLPRVSDMGDLSPRHPLARISDMGDLGGVTGRDNLPRMSDMGDLGAACGTGRNALPRMSDMGDLGAAVRDHHQLRLQLPRVSDMGDMSPTGTVMSDGQRWQTLWMQTQRESMTPQSGDGGHGRGLDVDDISLMGHVGGAVSSAPSSERHGWRDMMMVRGELPNPFIGAPRLMLDGLDAVPGGAMSSGRSSRAANDEALRHAATEERLLRLEDQLRAERHDNAQLQKKLAQTEKDVFELSRQNLDIEDKHLAMKQQRDAALREVAPLQSRVADMQRERGRILKEFAEERRALQGAQDEVRRLQSALASAGPGNSEALQQLQAQLEAERKGALAVMAAANQLQRKYRILQAVAEEREGAVQQLQALLEARELNQKDGQQRQEERQAASPHSRAMATLQADVGTLTRDNAALRQALEETIKGHQELLKHLALTARGQAQAAEHNNFPSGLLQLHRAETQDNSAGHAPGANGTSTGSTLLPVWPLTVNPPAGVASPSEHHNANHSGTPTASSPLAAPQVHGLHAHALAAALQGGDNDLVNIVVNGGVHPARLAAAAAAAAAGGGANAAAVSAAHRISLAAAAARNGSLSQSQELSAEGGNSSGRRGAWNGGSSR